MSASSFTEGPWYANPPPDTYLEVRARSNGRHICGDIDSWANARLISAAPDLLRALEDLVGFCYLHYELAGEMHESHLTAARAAVRLARGEES